MGQRSRNRYVVLHVRGESLGPYDPRLGGVLADPLSEHGAMGHSGAWAWNVVPLWTKNTENTPFFDPLTDDSICNSMTGNA